MTLLTTLLIIALLLTIASLAWGVGSMAHGGTFDREHSTQLMSARLVTQGLTIVLLLLAVVLAF
ncbi:MAG: HIG1 domain-containing protein [Pseudomonadota bacterium]|nr:MAG: HIG1 domain-containing protein [Pseudomonadota bacterium]